MANVELSSKTVLTDFDFDSFLSDSLPQPQEPPIHSTISRDRSKGVAARAEDNLQSLAKRYGRTNPRADISRPKPSLPLLYTISGGAKHIRYHSDDDKSLQARDYPTQLALEQELNQPREIWSTERSNDILDKLSDLEEHEPALDMGDLEEAPRHFAFSAEPQARALRRKRSQSSRSIVAPGSTKRRRAEDGKPRSMPRTVPKRAIIDPPSSLKHYQIIYAIKCYEKNPLGEGHHEAMLFDDEPARKGSSWSHLEGLHPHSSVSERLDAIAFTVFRAYHCTDMSRHQQRLYSSGPRVTELIHIQSPVLRSALQAVATYIPGDDFSQTWNLTTPHVFISHHRDALLNRARQEGESCMEDLKHLFEYVYTKWADPILTLERLTKAGNIDAKRLPWLYKPNEMIISIVKGVPTAYVLKSDPSWNEELTGITLECWAWDYNGFLLQRKGHELFVATPSNSDPTPIRNLSAYPLRFATKEVKDSVLARGRKYWGLRYQHHVSYLGWDAKGEEFYATETRCMLDYRTYKKFHPNSEDLSFRYQPNLFDHWRVSIPHDSELSEENLMLLPQTIHGFVLKQKDWTLLLVDNVEPVKWNKDAFDRLVVRPSTKEMIKALVMVRIMEREGERVMDLSRKRDDLIAGKGNGLIMLLHGGPGTGKTLTAESVAEIAEMPLYRVTCGEVGTTAEAVEKYLESILHLGKVWNCVLLLDEADVFLEERSMSDLERNSLVSVFLRILEYYDGILILTTNRVGTFDEAFQSRIQVAIHYPTLDYLSRKRIWENFFHLLYDDEQDADVDELRRHTEQLAEHQMNGRQIRNILTTARQLALYKQETLTWKHVDQAMTTAKDFSRYLQNVHGHSDEQWAREEKLR